MRDSMSNIDKTILDRMSQKEESLEAIKTQTQINEYREHSFEMKRKLDELKLKTIEEQIKTSESSRNYNKKYADLFYYVSIGWIVVALVCIFLQGYINFLGDGKFFFKEYEFIAILGSMVASLLTFGRAIVLNIFKSN